MVFYDLFCASILFELVLYFIVFTVYLLSALLFCFLSFSINFSCVLYQFCALILFEHVGPINFFFIVYAFIMQNSALISQVFYTCSVLEFYLNLYIVICLHFIYLHVIAIHYGHYSCN